MMSLETMEKQKKLLREILLVFIGAIFVLLITSLEGVSFENMRTDTSQSVSLLITGWYGIWLVLQLASLFFASYLFVHKDWRAVPFGEKHLLFFAYLCLGWVSMLAFVLRILQFRLQVLPWIVLVTGTALVIGYLLTWQRLKTPREIFP